LSMSEALASTDDRHRFVAGSGTGRRDAHSPFDVEVILRTP
jgi:hypothetical protein